MLATDSYCSITLFTRTAPHPNAEYAGDSVPRKFGPLDTLQVEELYQKGLAHEKFGQTDDAEEAYRAALAKDPLFSPVHLRLGLLAMDRFEYGEAWPILRKYWSAIHAMATLTISSGSSAPKPASL